MVVDELKFQLFLHVKMAVAFFRNSFYICTSHSSLRSRAIPANLVNKALGSIQYTAFLVKCFTAGRGTIKKR